MPKFATHTDLVPLPTRCPHGNAFKSFLEAPPGTVVYDPGCRSPRKYADLMAHYVGPMGLITKTEWNKLYGKKEGRR